MTRKAAVMLALGALAVVWLLGSVLFVAQLTGCRSSAPPAAPSFDASDAWAPTMPDARTEPPRDQACERACWRLAVLGCPEARGTDAESCAAFCDRTEAAKVFTVHPACVADASTVDAARACGVRCQGR